MRSIILFVFFVNALVNSQNTDVCRTPIGESGLCIPIRSCSLIVDVLQNAPKPLPAKVVEYVRNSHCRTVNNQHYVCCATRHTIQQPTASTTRRPPTIKPATPNNNIDFGVLSNNVVDVQKHPNLRLLSRERCGRVLGDKISNGNITSLGEFPFMALLQYETTEGPKFLCGGTLISKRYVLTAAHCVSGVRDPLISIRLGEHDISKEEDCEIFDNESFCQPPVQDIGIEEIRSHPNFNRPTRYANDIAVIRLSRDARFEENVEPICLPIMPELQSQLLESVIISGWGLTETGVKSNELLKANIEVIDNGQCQNVFRRSVRLLPSHLCAGGKDGVDSCKGDSGGPLFNTARYVSNIISVRYVQHGVIAAGSTICGVNLPSLYTRVSHHLSWILDQMRS